MKYVTYSVAVDYICLLPSVDRNRVGVVGICGLGGMALMAASNGSRIRAAATADYSSLRFPINCNSKPEFGLSF